MIVRCWIFALLAGFAALPALAQPRPLERGPELDKLAFLTGTWQAETTRQMPSGPLEFSSTVTFSWDVGGAWLRGEEEAAVPGLGDVVNWVLLTWDGKEGNYVGAWLDNMVAETVSFRARWVSDTALRLESGKFESGGAVFEVAVVYEKLGETQVRRTLEMARGGGELKQVSVTEMTRGGKRSPPES